jgi:hypothetical protein
MRLAADVGRDDQLRVAALQRIEPVVAQPLRKLGLGDRIRARRSAAQMGIGHRSQIEAEPLQDRLDRAAQLLRMLQRAGAVKRDAPLLLRWRFGRQCCF